MKRELKKGFGLISTQIELTNSEMDTLVQARVRVNTCVKSFDTEKPVFITKEEYRMFQDILDVLIGDYKNETENAFQKAFEGRKASQPSAMNIGEDDEILI